MDVLDDDDERTLGGDLLEHPADGPERLLGLCRAVVQADRGEHHPCEVGVEQRGDALATAELRDDLGERAVGHAVAV